MARQRRALGIALGVSAGLHALLWLGVTSVPFLRLSVAVPIEIVAMKKHAPAPPALEPTQEKPEKKTARVPKPVSPGTSAPKPALAPPPVQDVHAIGPASANVTLVLRTSLVKSSPYREGTEQLLALLPDYHTLLDGTTLKLYDDVSALLVATPDPRDVAATFLAARHADDPRFEQVTRKSLGAHDPRVFRALGPDLTVLGPPEVLATLDQVGATGLSEGRLWIAALRTFDIANPQVALQLTIADLSQLVRFPGALPQPRSIQLAMSAEASPAVRLVCTFDKDDEALRFASMWPSVQRRVGEVLPIFSGALDQLPATQHERSVEMVGHLLERDVKTFFTVAHFALRPDVSPAPQTAPATDAAPLDQQ